MIKKISSYSICIACFFIIFSYKTRGTYAENELNNKFGIHLLQPSDEDLKQTRELVNSSHGDWGYVTVVIQENDRDVKKWQELFDKLRRLHLIPIVRLATHPEGVYWRRPAVDDADSWVDFLNSLNWVVKNRYIILFNEPNHGKEWGGRVDAESYAEVAFSFAQKLKQRNNDFFVLLAGLDAAAPSKPPLFEDEQVFLKKIQDATFSGVPRSSTLINFIDGLVSHSYPNHGFVGTPSDTGKHSIRTYQWELSLLKELGIEKNLPVFITETGWPHTKNEKLKLKKEKLLYYSPEKAGAYIRIAYEHVWLKDDRVRAVTPFVFNYPVAPFDVFSWKYPSGEGLYPAYHAVQSISKIKGNPAQEQAIFIEKNQILSLPKELTTNSTYTFKIILQNEGQSIIDIKEGYEVRITADAKKRVTYVASDFIDFEPFNSQPLNFFVKIGDTQGEHRMNAALVKERRVIKNLFVWDFTVTGPPPLQFGVRLYPKLASTADNIELQFFDAREQLVFQKKHVVIKERYGLIDEVHNIVLGKRYRVVILKPYYLPRQKHIIFNSLKNVLIFEKMIPLDFNQDGKFSFADMNTLIRNPFLLKLWWMR